MLTIPTLTTQRLLLRPFTQADVPRIAPLANDRRIAINIPLSHPYTQAHAEQFVSKDAENAATDEGFSLAIIIAETRDLIGSIGFHLHAPDARASFGYWLGIPYWNHGYATEAASALVEYLFLTLNLHRVTAAHFANNPASGRVMQKLGMTHEGTFRQHIRQSDAFVDDIHYGLLREEWLARR